MTTQMLDNKELQRTSFWRRVTMSALAAGVVSLMAGFVVAASEVPQTPEVSVEAESTAQGAKLAIRGKNWPARVTLTLSASTPPGGSAEVALGTVQSTATGEFRATKLTPCTSSAPSDAKVTITVKAGDISASSSIPSDAWVCARD